MQTLKAIEMGAQTLVGVLTREYPLKRGNCFSVLAEDGNSYRIVNFSAENLEELTRRGVVDFPFNIKLLNERTAVVHDIRIPDGWYDARWCAVCCPKDLLPLPQQLEYFRGIERGDITEKAITLEDGSTMILVSQKINVDNPVLSSQWTLEEPQPIEIEISDEAVEELAKQLEKEITQGMQPGLIYCPDIPKIFRDK